MTHIEQAIRDAVEKGGWTKNDEHGCMCVAKPGAAYPRCYTDRTVCYYKIFLDPAFWQALGRARRWEQGEFEICFGCGVRIKPNTPDRKSGKHYLCHSNIQKWDGEWRFQAELFFEHIMEGKSAEWCFEQMAI